MNFEIKDIIRNKLELSNNDAIKDFDLEVLGSTANKVANKGIINIHGFEIFSHNEITKIVAKIKSPKIITNMGIMINTQNDKDFQKLYNMNYKIFGLENSHVREYLIYEGINNNIKVFLPEFLGNIKHENENILLLKYFKHSNDEISIDLIIEFLTELHSTYLEKKEVISNFLLNYNTINEYKKAKKLLFLMYESLVSLYKNSIPDTILSNIKNDIKNIDKIVKRMQKYYLTLNHGDFNYKNICLRENNILVYDWEMSSYLNPQFDLITYLSYLDSNIITKQFIEIFIEKYIQEIEKKGNLSIDKEEFYDVFKLNINYFFIIRLMGLLLLHNKMPLSHIEKVLKNWIKIYENIKTE